MGTQMKQIGTDFLVIYADQFHFHYLRYYLFNKVLNAEVSDTTNDAMKTKAG
jgi:hypothetical protein